MSLHPDKISEEDKKRFKKIGVQMPSMLWVKYWVIKRKVCDSYIFLVNFILVIALICTSPEPLEFLLILKGNVWHLLMTQTIFLHWILPWRCWTFMKERSVVSQLLSKERLEWVKHSWLICFPSFGTIPSSSIGHSTLIGWWISSKLLQLVWTFA